MTVALLLAAGSGERLGADRPKAWVPVGGRPLFGWSLDAIARTESISQVVIAFPPGGPEPEVGVGAALRVEFVAGGASRSESVRLALAAAHDDELVLVHDAARPLVTPAIARAVIDAVADDPDVQAATAAAPVTDTIKRASAEHVVAETLQRGALWSIQTPQVFRREALDRALDAPAEVLAAATDDASLIEQNGGRVLVVPTTAENIKVTTALDLRLAELLLAGRRDDPA
ncbi:MAG TPA: 2-C-methyl-D-erythritol 4-phosphate cytidylyltransferase [Solirubrobacteraceae bacterium]|nr:2-C-methyl-D-erythritol 4-phosphate cytidylyltransferase [Solirubrobacteraceae bacterium]